MVNGDDSGAEIEIVQRSFSLGKLTFGWVSYRGQRCKVIYGNCCDGAQFEAVYYPSKGKWK